METRAHHIIIGFFTLAAAIAAMVFALWLAKSGVEDGPQVFDIVFTESVTGLSVGSQVLYNGIPMGEVTDLRLDKKDPRNVIARIRISDEVPVTRATGARLTIANITGAAVIQLISGPPGSTPLISKDEKIPVIEASPSPFSQLRNASEELVVNITRLAENAGKIVSEENTAHLNNILTNLDTTTTAIAGEKEAFATSIRNIAAVSKDIQGAVNQASQLFEKLNTSYDTQGEELLNSAHSSLKSVEQVASSLEKLIADNQGALNQSIQGATEIGPLLQELRTTIATLGDISRRLEEDPSGFLLGGEQIKEYQP